MQQGMKESGTLPTKEGAHSMYSVFAADAWAIKHRNQIWAAILGTFIVGLGATVSVQAAPRQRA